MLTVVDDAGEYTHAASTAPVDLDELCRLAAREMLAVELELSVRPFGPSRAFMPARPDSPEATIETRTAAISTILPDVARSRWSAPAAMHGDPMPPPPPFSGVQQLVGQLGLSLEPVELTGVRSVLR